MIPFVKLEAAGNGYVIVDGRAVHRSWSTLARAICDPHLGVGSDGLAVVARSDVAPIRMRIFNSDGSESEMSGNGIRLFAKFVLDSGIVRPIDGAIEIETGGGVRRVYPTIGEHGMIAASVAMGVPRFDPASIPVEFGGGADGRVVDHPLEIAGRRIEVTCLSIGNPHAVSILAEDIDTFPLEEIGAQVVEHPIFPNRINFEILNPIDRGRIRARIFERGEGETLASGTGSSACVIAARLHDLVDDDVEVELRGGVLRIRWDGLGDVTLEGPAVEVYRGIWPD